MQFLDLAEGTPKNLGEAIHTVKSTVPLNLFDKFAKQVIRDYIAQKFSVAVLKNPDNEKMLMDLFEEIVK